jgi:hypothetical protein
MYVPNPPVGQYRGSIPKDGWGPSGGRCMDSAFGYAPFRKDRVFYKWTRTAGQGLFVPAGQSVMAFAKGPDQEDTQGGYPTGVQKSEADTLAYEDGALTDEGEVYEVNGISIAVRRPVVIVNRGVAPTGQTLSSPEWVNAYDDELREQTLTYLGVQLEHGAKRCEWFAGNLSDFPTAGGPTGSNIISNGANAAIGIYLPLETADYAGSTNSNNKLRVKMANGNMQLAIDEKTVATAADVYVPIEVTAWGRPLSESLCGKIMECLTDDELAYIAARRKGQSSQQGPG